jgi:hypothetical protein
VPDLARPARGKASGRGDMQTSVTPRYSPAKNLGGLPLTGMLEVARAPGRRDAANKLRGKPSLPPPNNGQAAATPRLVGLERSETAVRGFIAS